MLHPYLTFSPEVDPTVYIAPSADVIGKVKIGAYSSIWFQVVIRGDVNTIEIGERTNVQDQSILHVTRKIAPLKIGNDVTIGHRVTLHGCTLHNRILVGMGTTIMDHAEIPDDCIIGAGSLITENKKFPSKVLIMGTPAKVIRDLTEVELQFLKKSAENYVGDAKEYLTGQPLG